MARSPKSVRHLLKDKPALKRLELEISTQKALLDQIRLLLPDDLRNHCVASQKREQLLILHTDSPVWATRLRYLAPQLITLMKPGDPSLRGIKVKLVLTRSPRHRKLPSARHSDFAAAIIHDSAEDTKQPQLREALERLSIALKR